MKVLICGIQHSVDQAPLVGASLKAFAHKDPALLEQAPIKLHAVNIWAPDDDIVSGILAEEPDMIGFPCYVWNWTVVRRVCARLRALRTDAWIVVGGPEVSVVARTVLAENPGIDIVVNGEGEETFVELLEHSLGRGKPLDQIKGITYRSGENSVETPERPLLSADRLVSPYLSGIPEVQGAFEFATLETSRGCPFDCKFCDWGTNQKIRWYPVERVVAELEFLARRASVVYLSDSDIYLDRSRARRLLQSFLALSERHPVRLNMDANPIFLDDKTMRLLNSSQITLGCGVQSIDPKVLEVITRPQNFAKLNVNIDKLKTLAPRLKTNIHIIYGLPGDTLAGFERGIDWELSKRIALPGASHTLILPGAGMGKDPDKYGVLDFEAEPPHRVLSTTTFSADDLLRATRMATYMRAFVFDPVVRSVLDELAQAAVGSAELPFFSTYEAFFLSLCESGCVPFQNLQKAQSYDEAGKISGLWSMQAKLEFPSIHAENPTDEIFHGLERFAERRIEAGSLRALAPVIKASIADGLRRNRWCRRTPEMRQCLEHALDSYADDFKPGSRVLLLGTGITRLLKSLTRRGIEPTAVELESCSYYDTVLVTSALFFKDQDELMEMGWDANAFDVIVIAPVAWEASDALRRALIDKTSKWLKPDGKLLVFGVHDASHAAEFPVNRALVDGLQEAGAENALHMRADGAPKVRDFDGWRVSLNVWRKSSDLVPA